MLLLLQLLVCALASLGVDVLLLFFSVQQEVRSPQQVRDVQAMRYPFFKALSGQPSLVAALRAIQAGCAALQLSKQCRLRSRLTLRHCSLTRSGTAVEAYSPFLPRSCAATEANKQAPPSLAELPTPPQ